ncbi:hypothetical protein [Aggregatilinea lenta]|uniref:hypothetical protein n=1 Tax=Aggregatilinea lenta TaxID=913108 RepID=UPI000E5C067D|nr:hypothetical protein [Aggregatilinea lenta]
MSDCKRVPNHITSITFSLLNTPGTPIRMINTKAEAPWLLEMVRSGPTGELICHYALTPARLQRLKRALGKHAEGYTEYSITGAGVILTIEL